MKTVSIIITVGLVVALGILFVGNGEGKLSANNVEIKDGVQYVRIEARGGYFPRVSTAKAGVPTKLIMKTSGTFDCSSALVVRAANFKNILAPNSETEIDLGTKQAGDKVDGICSMGMYNFVVNFKD